MTTTPPPSPLKGRYEIIRQLGAGGMGTVYLARDLNLRVKLVALKANRQAAPDFQKQFIREAQVLARLTHRALPSVTDYFTDDEDRQYLVMDYIDGQDLLEIAQAHDAPLQEAQVLRWLEEILDALAYLHRQTPPIIHRDIKPSNIKLRMDGQLFLVDFGLAKVAEEESSREYTQLSTPGLTSGYAPPEQYTGGTDARSDLYAVGATLYYLLTHQRPPAAEARKDGAALKAPRSLNPALSRKMDTVILKAMQLDPQERYQSVAQMQQALDFTILPPPSPDLSKPAPRPHKRSLDGLLLGVLILLFLALSGMLVVQNRPDLLDQVQGWLAAVINATTPTPAPTPTVAPSATATPTLTPTITPTATPTVTPTATPTAKPTATPTVTPTVTVAAPEAIAPSPTPTCPEGMVFIQAEGVAPFCLDQYEVTNAEYQECLEVELCDEIAPDRKRDIPGYSGDSTYFDDEQYRAYPVLNLTLAQAIQYCEKYGNYQQRSGSRLPAFEEWISLLPFTTEPPLPTQRQPLPVNDARLDVIQAAQSNEKLVALRSNVGEWVTVAADPDGRIAVVVGESYNEAQFARARTMITNYRFVNEGEQGVSPYFDVGVRCAADPQ